MYFLLFSLLILSPLAQGSCCGQRFGQPINEHDWSEYVFNVKAQGQQPSCWAESTASFIEIVHNYKTGSKIELSSQQLYDHTYQQSSADTICKPKTDMSKGGYPICALRYVGLRGIMTDFDYKYNGYDVRNTMPLGIDGIDNVYSVKSQLGTFLKYLNNTPIIGVFRTSETASYFMDDIDYAGLQFHGVVVTNVCHKEGINYVEFLNSYGQAWGKCNGFGYIRITDNNKTVNNRWILSEIITANVYDLRIPRSLVCYNQMNVISTQYQGVIGLLTLIVLILGACFAILMYMLHQNTLSRSYGDIQ
jgi:hypothetical protein